MLLKDLCPFLWKIMRFLWFTHFCCKTLSWEFTYFFRRFFWTEKQNPQNFLLFGCMYHICVKRLINSQMVFQFSFFVWEKNHANMFQVNDEQQEANTRRRVKGVKVFVLLTFLNKLQLKKYVFLAVFFGTGITMTIGPLTAGCLITGWCVYQWSY